MLRKSLRRAFAKVHADILQNLHTDPLTGARRKLLICQKAVQSFTDPTNPENISELGDLTSYYALSRARSRMQ